MKLVLKDTVKAELFTHLFKNLPNVCESLSVQFHDDHMYIQSMDSHHICLVEVKLDDTWFDEYEVNDSDSTTISMRTDIMQMILRCKSPSQQLTFGYDGDPDKLYIVFDNGDKDTYDKDFEMPLMVLDQDMLSVPSNSEWETEFELNSQSFHTLMSEMEQFSDTLDITCSEETFKLAGSGSNGLYKISFNIEDLESYSIDEDTTIKASYSVRYCSMISSFSKLSSVLHFEASSKLPIKMTYKLSDDEESNYLKFYLAPKMNEDD